MKLKRNQVSMPMWIDYKRFEVERHEYDLCKANPTYQGIIENRISSWLRSPLWQVPIMSDKKAQRMVYENVSRIR